MPRSNSLKSRQFSFTIPKRISLANIKPEIFETRYEFEKTGWGEIPTSSILNTSTQDYKLWPRELGPVLVLSIRRNRFDGFVKRMGPWMTHMKRFNCTDGRFINPSEWLRNKQITQMLSAGRIGCYDSHVKIWKTIAQGPHEVVTVFEDDVDFSWGEKSDHFYNCVRNGLKELIEKNVQWDFLSWGYGPQAINKNVPIVELKYWKTPNICQGFFAYTLTRKMANLLIQKCFPYKDSAVDMWFYWNFVKRNPVKVLCLEPPLCFVINGPSETTKLLN
jgi:GR25 family glycosyltransferase involved in LPS biosynthesis